MIRAYPKNKFPFMGNGGFSSWPIRQIEAAEVWRVVKGSPREWIGIVLHDGAENTAVRDHDVQSYANDHTLPAGLGGRGYSDLGYHFGVEEDGGIWISDAWSRARWIWQREGIHTQAMDSLDGRIHMIQGVNMGCIGICFAGNFADRPPTPQAYAGGVHLCVELLDRLGLDAGSIYRHSQFEVRDCPGPKFPFEALVAEVQAALDKRRALSPA